MGGWGRDKRQRRARWLWRRAGTLSAAFLVVACATQDSESAPGAGLNDANQLFSVGYRDIADIYIQEVPSIDLAVAGLSGLSSIDPAFKVSRDGGWILLDIGGDKAATLSVPARGDAEGWGNLTAAALDLSRRRSAELNTADPEQLYEVVFDGMLGKLDKFSRYSGREEARENRASRDGFGGIGVRIRLVDAGVRILSVMDHTPAKQSGLADDDIIVSIDGENTVGLSQREVVRRLRGPLHTRVVLGVKRVSAPAPLNIEVARAHIVPQTVRYERLGATAHIRVSGFNQNTARNLREAIKLASAEMGDELGGFILDLRGNPGGLLDQSVAVSDLFVTDGRIVSTHGRHPDSHQYFEAEPDDLAHAKPVVVLVNGNSASASEIVAAALQDSGRAVVVGSSSYGKGTVQTVLRLPNEGELTLTWARFHAPSGYALNGRGVMPDICTSPIAAGEQIEAAQIVEQVRSGRLPVAKALIHRDLTLEDEKGIEAFRASCPPAQGESGLELEVAQRLLEDPVLFARAIGGTVPSANQALATKAAQPKVQAH